MEPLGHGAIRSLHLGDRREHGALPCRSVLVRTLFCLELFGALPHRGPFLCREPLGLLCAHRVPSSLRVDLCPSPSGKKYSTHAAPCPHFSSRPIGLL